VVLRRSERLAVRWRAEVALPVAVFLASGSLRNLSFVAAASSIPMLLFLLIGGAVADRFPRRVVSIQARG
jgi:MFS family permease